VGLCGVPEVPSGHPSPPQSPPLAAIAVSYNKHSSTKNARTRRGGAAFTIAEKCERLFCETLKTIFLGEGDLDFQDSLVMGAQTIDSNIHQQIEQDAAGSASPPLSSSFSSSNSGSEKRLLTDWLEMWDYGGGARFRGFMADGTHGRTMFAFFDNSVLGNDLKPGLMALLELCNMPEIDCSNLVVCVDRSLALNESKVLLRDLGWVGFEPLTLGVWASEPNLVSQRWMLLGMEA